MIENNSNKLMWAAGAIVVLIVLLFGIQFTFPEIFGVVGNKIETVLVDHKSTDKPQAIGIFKFAYNSSNKMRL